MFEQMDNDRQLAVTYAASAVLLNLAKEDSYLAVNLEAEACKTDNVACDAGDVGRLS